MSDVNVSNQEQEPPKHNFGDFSRPPQMTEVHSELLKAFWNEGMTPTQLKEELLSVCPELKPHEARNIVGYWMWSEHFVTRKGTVE